MKQLTPILVNIVKTYKIKIVPQNSLTVGKIFYTSPRDKDCKMDRQSGIQIEFSV